MKKLYTLILGALSVIGLAQAPANYYSGTEGLTKEELKTKLSAIISKGHTDNGYDGLWRGYYTTDVDNYYEKDGTLLDIYSEVPSGIDSYTYKIGAKQCGTYSGEGHCYNREHIVPQSLFNKESPMRNDIHFIVPTDGYVNGKRSNYPFDVVSTATWTSKNGSRLGKNASGSIVFEPIDEFKGDVARMIFYFATRYESQLSGFKTGGILGGSAYPGIDANQLDILLRWHNADPVSQKEIDRNNYAYEFQGNRNPFIDNPDWVNAVWGTSTLAEETPTPAPEEPETPTTGEHCGGVEDFENIPNGGTKYGEYTWENNGITWTATDSRTDQTINGKAITVRKGSLKSSTVSGGVGNLTLTTQRKYAGSEAGELTLMINGVEKGKIPYGADIITTTIENINIAENATIEIVNTHDKDRVAIDDLSWTCYEEKDTEAPTTPTNVVITETTTESISLEWTESTDNVGVEAYDIYVNGELKKTTAEPDVVLEGLNPDTEYSITIVARDEAGNQSTPSEAVVGKTKPVEVDVPTTGDECKMVEDFETMPSVQGYKEVVWENNGITWTATDSRTDQTINGRAITVRKGSLKSSAVSGGIGSLTLTTKLPFKDKTGDLIVKVNDKEVGKISYVEGGELTTTTIDNINIEGNVEITIVNETSNRVAIDDLSWTCYSNGEEETPIEETPVEDKDTEAPTTPTNVAITETTTESISLEWTASTDNVGVVAYDVYVDGELKATVSEPNAVLEGLTPDTEYSITIVARDEAGNQSTPSEAVVGKTKPVEAEQPIEENPAEQLEYCYVEDFENMGSISNYGNVTWENNGITWTAVNVRTDQDINGSKALTFRHATNSSLTSSTIKGGVGSLTITTQLKFSGSEGELAIVVNDVEVGKVPYSAEVQTTTIKDINVSGNAVIYIANPEGKNRIAIDNISWTCYSNGEEEEPIEETPIEETPIEETPIVEEPIIEEKPRYSLPNVVERGKMVVYPNPVRSYEPFGIYGLERGKVYTAEVYNSAGRLITKFENIKGEDAVITINQHLAPDVYILRINGKGIKFLVK